MTRALLLVADGFAERQTEYAYHRLREDGIAVDVASPGGGSVTGRRGLVRERTLAAAALDADPGIVVVPGGQTAERLRLDDPSLERIGAAVAGRAVVGAIGHGVQALPAVDALTGRTVAGPPALRVDLENAGATWIDDRVAVDGNLVTARDTDSLPFFLSAILHSLSIPQASARDAVERPHWARTRE